MSTTNEIYKEDKKMQASKSIDMNIKNKIVVEKIPHGTSQLLLYKRGLKDFYLSAFTFFYSKGDIVDGKISRPTIWVLADIETGEIVERYDTKNRDFSDARYDVKYNVRSAKKYDTSMDYYERAFAILDLVRKKIIEEDYFDEVEYRKYFDMILANIPEDYQRFYRDLSV